MKNLLLLILALIVLVPKLQAQETAAMADHYPLAFVFADGVNLRAAPNLEAKVVANVNAGTPIRLFGNVGTDTINGKISYWNKIYYKGQIAYVWHPLITYHVQRSGKNPDYYFLLGEGDSTWHSKIKVIHKGKTVQQISFRGIKSFQAVDQYLNKGPMGVPLVDDLIYVHWSAHSCGHTGGYKIFAFDGQRLHYFGEDTGMGDGGFFTSQTLTTPADPAGEKGVVVIKMLDGETIFPEDGQENQEPTVKYNVNTTTRYRWNGKKLVKI
ncbi:MAG: SH3 domain-containing protein [Bacteroidota bacterium]